MIIPVKEGRGDLNPPTECECQSFPKREPSDHRTWGQENLRFPIVLAVLEMRAVYFHFRPELSINVIRKGIVSRIRAADCGFLARRPAGQPRRFKPWNAAAF